MLHTICGSIGRKGDMTTITLAGRDPDGTWIGQRCEISTERLAKPGILVRTLNFMTRDLEARGVV